MPYQSPVPVHSKGKSHIAGNHLSLENPPQARKTPDPSQFVPMLKRRSSSNYQSAILSNQFQSTHIAKVSPPIDLKKEDKKEFPFKTDYSLSTQNTHQHLKSPSLSPEEETNFISTDTDNHELSRWSSERTKRSLQRGSIDLTHESDRDHGTYFVDYNFGQEKNPSNDNGAQKLPGSALHRRSGSFVYHSNQEGSESQFDLNKGKPIVSEADKKLINPSSFQYDDFKRRMQYE